MYEVIVEILVHVVGLVVVRYLLKILELQVVDLAKVAIDEEAVVLENTAVRRAIDDVLIDDVESGSPVLDERDIEGGRLLVDGNHGQFRQDARDLPVMRRSAAEDLQVVALRIRLQQDARRVSRAENRLPHAVQPANLDVDGSFNVLGPHWCQDGAQHGVGAEVESNGSFLVAQRQLLSAPLRVGSMTLDQLSKRARIRFE